MPHQDLHESGCAATRTSARRAFRCLKRERDVAAGTRRSTTTTVVSGNDAQNSSLHNESPASATGFSRCSRNAPKHTPQTHAELCNPASRGIDGCFDRSRGCLLHLRTSQSDLSRKSGTQLLAWKLRARSIDAFTPPPVHWKAWFKRRAQ